MKKKYIRIGIILLVIIVVFSLLSYLPIIPLYIKGESLNPFFTLGFISIIFTLLGISESSFIKAEIVPKWLRILIYFQWIFVPLIIVPTLIHYLIMI